MIDTCASITWTRIATTISCATCSTSVQRARVRRVDDVPTQGSWSLRSEHDVPLPLIIFDILLHTLRECLLVIQPEWYLNRQPLWLALIEALEYTPSYSPSDPYFERFALSGSICVGPPGVADHAPAPISISNRRLQSTISVYTSMRWRTTGHSPRNTGDF